MIFSGAVKNSQIVTERLRILIQNSRIDKKSAKISPIRAARSLHTSAQIFQLQSFFDRVIAMSYSENLQHCGVLLRTGTGIS